MTKIARYDPATDPMEWWRNTIDLHPPETPEVGKVMDNVRGWFRSLGEMMIEELPPGPDLTVALRALKEASMHAIGAVACNQHHYLPTAEDAGASDEIASSLRQASYRAGERDSPYPTDDAEGDADE